MNTIQYPAANAGNFEIKTLPNGLTVIVSAMPDFSTVHAIYGTKFGSVHRDFMRSYKAFNLPAGIAHFLEHKMFDNEEGDAFSLFAKTGANANAYTSFEKTCYIFTATQQIERNLDILLSFVSKPYFTSETVQKEQGIIAQEIKMYDDSPEWRLMFAALACLYSSNFIKDDVAGTIESITNITPELLYTCADAFYRPDNMVLAVAGNINMQTVLDACERAQISAKQEPITMLSQSEDSFPIKKELTFNMSVSKPLFCLSFKEKPIVGTPLEMLKAEIIYDIITELIAGSMTPLYRKLYDEGLVAPGFSGELLNSNGATCVFFSGETNEPQKVKELLLNEIEHIKKHGADEQMFKLCKNLMYGELICSLDNVEGVASEISNIFFKERTPAQMMQVLANLKLSDVDEMLNKVLKESTSASVIINPL